VIRIADRPHIIVHFHGKACDLKLSDANGFFCLFDPIVSLETQQRVLRWLEEYSLKRRNPSQFFLPQGTPFQTAVWEVLIDIPFGETLSYKAIARQIDRPRSLRAVGRACGRNRTPLFIPCHRVIAQDGSIGGYAYGLEIKKQLLEFERNSLP
jgi:O-6-methylguanine DNA methyltransferase